jgi:hypothetical protein
MLPLMSACTSKEVVRLSECPVPAFLAPVKPQVITPGMDAREAFLRRSAELAKANGRLVKAESYLQEICGGDPAKPLPG